MSDKHWKPGQSGNPVGRPTGARTRFTEAFVGDVAKAWEQHGAGVLEQMAASEPSKFAELCSRLIPRDVSLKLEQPQTPHGLSSEDWRIVLQILQAIKQTLPDAGLRPPGEILEFVASAIRGKTIE
jgi:Family of unknown function (DUF5681)